MNRQLRIYTKRNLKPGFFDNFLRKHSITTWLIIVNVIIWVVAMLSMRIFDAEKVFLFLALQPNAFFSGQVWQVLTSMFMHSPNGMTHLFVNMLSLFLYVVCVKKLSFITDFIKIVSPL